MMPHFPHRLHSVLQMASAGLAWGMLCSALGSAFAPQRSGGHCWEFEHSLSTENSFGRVRGMRSPLSFWRSIGTASWAPCQSDPYFHGGAVVRNAGSRYSGHKITIQREDSMDVTISVVLENSNVAQLASALYLLVHSLPQEDRYDTDDASAREISSILVPESTLCTVQSLRHRQYCASRLDRHGQAHRTVALHPVPPRVLRAGGHLDGAE